MPTTPEARAKYLKRRRAKLKRIRDASDKVFRVIEEWDNEMMTEQNRLSWSEVYDALNYITRQARKAC